MQMVLFRKLLLSFGSTSQCILTSLFFRKRKWLAEKYCCLKISLEEFRCTDWTTEVSVLRYRGKWIFMKNAKNLFFVVQIKKTEKNSLQKEWRKKLFLLFTIK